MTKIRRSSHKRWISTYVEYQWKDDKYVKVKEEGYWYEGPIAFAGDDPNWVSTYWRFQEDGTESSPTWLSTENGNPTKGDIPYDTPFFFRIDVEEDSGNASKNTEAQLQYRYKPSGGSFGAWTDVTATSSVIRSIASDNVTDGGNTSQQLSGGYTFDTTNNGIDEVNGIAGGGDADLASTGMEFLFVIEMRSADVNEDDEIELSIILNAVADDPSPTYPSSWPLITAGTEGVTTYTSSGDTQAIKAAGTGVAEVAYEVYTSSGDTQAIKAAGTGVAKSEEAAYYERILIQEPRLYLPNEKPVGSVVIDWDHPSTYGLKAAYLFDNIVGGDTVKALNGFGPDITLETDTSTLPYIEVRNGIKGLGKENSHQSFGYIAAGEIPTAGDDVSCIMYGVNGNTSSTGLFTMYGPTGGQTDFQHWFGSAAFQWKPFDTDGAEGDALNMFSGDWPSPFNIEINAIAWQNSNTNEMAFFTRRASNTSGPCFKAMGPSSITNGCTTWPADRIWILGMDADSIGTNNGDGTRAQWWGGRYNYLFFFNREIHEAEAFSLTQDPFQILKPA